MRCSKNAPLRDEDPSWAMGDSRLWSTIVENGLEPADLAWLALAMNRADQRRVEAEATLAEGLMGHSQAVVDAISGVRNATNGVEMREAERAVHAVLRAEGDALVECALQLRALDEDFVEQARADAHSRAQASGTRLHSRGYKSTPVRLLGGSIISLLALFLSPATPKSPEARRSRGKRGSAGAGVYPALDALGIADRASPALRETVAREVVAAFSFDAARGTLRQQGIEMDHRAALRLTYAFAEDAMKASHPRRARPPRRPPALLPAPTDPPRRRRRGPRLPALAGAGPRANPHPQRRLDQREPTQGGLEMRIRMMADGRVLEGTAKQIAEAMHALAFGQENHSLSEYIDWAVDQARRMNEIDMQVEGETDDAKAKSLVRAMLEAGLAERL